MGLLEELVAPVADAAGVKPLLGVRHLVEHAAPPRVVWVPTRDVFVDAHQARATARTARVIRNGFDVFCWGKGFDDARALRSAVLAALEKVAPGAYRLEDAQWVGFDRPEWLRRGEAWIVRVTVDEALTDTTYTTVDIDAVATDSTGAVPGDGILTCGES